uniref:Uncharacterized protein n=1 Tax=Rhizophagus irregularis (strain DAOM 181602 / DAOM 197198 / MUCL 43194) TaxID=747089 RepID=U9UIR6_RHIID
MYSVNYMLHRAAVFDNINGLSVNKKLIIQLQNHVTLYYKIIKKKTYPLINQLHYTRNLKHPIPHNYIVKIQYEKANYIVKCSINYVKGKPLFIKVNFGANFAIEVHFLESSTKAVCKYYQLDTVAHKVIYYLEYLILIFTVIIYFILHVKYIILIQ